MPLEPVSNHTETQPFGSNTPLLTLTNHETLGWSLQNAFWGAMLCAQEIAPYCCLRDPICTFWPINITKVAR